MKKRKSWRIRLAEWIAGKGKHVAGNPPRGVKKKHIPLVREEGSQWKGGENE